MYEILDAAATKGKLSFSSIDLKENNVPFEYVQKVAKQIVRNTPSLYSQPDAEELLAKHLFKGGVLSLRCFHKKVRRSINLDSALIWDDTLQGDDFWEEIYVGEPVPPYVVDKNGEYHV